MAQRTLRQSLELRGLTHVDDKEYTCDKFIYDFVAGDIWVCSRDKTFNACANAPLNERDLNIFFVALNMAYDNRTWQPGGDIVELDNFHDTAKAKIYREMKEMGIQPKRAIG